MSDNMIVQASRKDLRYLAALLFIVMTSLSVSIWIGCRMPSADVGGIVSLTSPFEDGFIRGAVKLCFWEILPLAVFAFAHGQLFRAVFAAAVFCVRGAAVGASVVFCIENAACISGAVLLCIIISYAAVTLLIAVFTVILSWKNDLCIMYKFFAYMTAAGAVAILRILPYLLIK